MWSSAQGHVSREAAHSSMRMPTFNGVLPGCLVSGPSRLALQFSSTSIFPSVSVHSEHHLFRTWCLRGAGFGPGSPVLNLSSCAAQPGQETDRPVTAVTGLLR